MDIEKIEKILGALAKRGDRETLKLVSSLLLEVASFEGKKETIKEETVVEKEEAELYETEVVLDKYSHAATILDGLPDSPYDRRASRVNYNTSNSVTNIPMNVSDMLSHADMLI